MVEFSSRYWDIKTQNRPSLPLIKHNLVHFQGMKVKVGEGKFPNLADIRHIRIRNSAWSPSFRIWDNFQVWGGKVEAFYALRISTMVRNWWVNIAFYKCVVCNKTKEKQNSHSSNGYKYIGNIMLYRRKSSISAWERMGMIYWGKNTRTWF